MTGEAIALALFVVLPLATGWAAARYIGRRRARPATRRELVAGNLLVLAFLLSTAALAGELWFRWGYDKTDSFAMLRSTHRWFDRHYRRNNANVRDDVDYGFGAVPAGKRRITFVGDSFTAGHGVANVADRFANRVRAARPGWEVHVLAENGIDTPQETAVLRDKVPPGYAFDVVVLVYCLNDIGDLLPESHALAERIGDIRRDRGVLAESSALFDVLRLLRIRASEPGVRDYFTFLRGAYEGPAWETQRRRLQEFHDVVRARGGRLAAVTFPFLQDLTEDDPFFSGGALARLANHWNRLAVPHLDLFPTFRGRDPDDLVVGAFDAHPNERAHALAAEAMLPFLDEVTTATPR